MQRWSVDLPNVASAIYKQNEGSFLAGVLAGLVTTDTKDFPLSKGSKKVGLVGGVAPTTGADSIRGGVMGNLGTRVAPLLQVAKVPIGVVATTLIRFIRPFGGPVADLYGLVSPPADRALLARPEIKAMFLDDLLNGSRRQMAAPFYDVIAFARDWGFRLDEVKVHVRWWHGDADHIVPYAHGQHVVSLLPDAELFPMPGESHLGGLGRAEEIRRAILSHANYIAVPRVSKLERTLFACDELAGFLTACSYVKPGRSIFEVDTASVKRKLKDKAFARNVSREDILGGAQELGVPLDEHIAFCIEAMKARAPELGLAGIADNSESAHS